MTLYEKLFSGSGHTDIWVLIDPDKISREGLISNAAAAEKEGASAILIGGSFLVRDDFDSAIKAVKDVTDLPVVLFPGSSRQVSGYADGILFLSLLSGRNPQYLIGEQVMAAPVICRLGLESIPTAYLLIESGRMTSAEFVSNTKPLPRDKPQLAVAHAQAAMLFGMKAVYLEAGSGAENSVPPEIVKMVVESVSIPVIVGGGITNPEQGVAVARAGARAIVVGTAVEKSDMKVLREMAKAIRRSFS